MQWTPYSNFQLAYQMKLLPGNHKSTLRARNKVDMMAFSKLLLNTQNSSRPLKTRPAVSAKGTMAPINKVISLSLPTSPQVIPAAAKASNHFTLSTRPLEMSHLHWLKVNPGSNAWILSAIACLAITSSSCQRFLPSTSCCVLLGCSAGNGRRKHEAENQATDLWKGQSVSPMQGVCGMQGRG